MQGWEIPLPLVVLGGYTCGFFCHLEAAAVTAGYALLVEVVVKGNPIEKLPAVMRESMVLVGGILLILGVSFASTNYLIDAQIPRVCSYG